MRQRSTIRSTIIEILKAENRPMRIPDIRAVARSRGMNVGANLGVFGNAMYDPETRELREEFWRDDTTGGYTLRSLRPLPPESPQYEPIDESGTTLDRLDEFSHRILVKNNNTQRNRAPNEAGIYFLHDNHYRVVYVGLSKSYQAGIRGRLQTHHLPAAGAENQGVKYSYFSYALITDDLIEPLERLLIAVFNPRANTVDRKIADDLMESE